ncbi:MAG: molecular chaperone SurA [Legionella sp. 40-6]|nr:peptidylprolyl isomerase [Legionella sp.]OJY54802.1 MAG: molecular chaperone SurA [Legionella sp. 40-6]
MFKQIILGSVLLIISSFAQAKQVIDKVVAVVNDGVITASELEKQVSLTKKQLLAQRRTLPDEKALRKQILQQLIDVDLQLQMAKQHGITVDENELNQAIERIAAGNHATVTQIREEIAKQGMSWNEYRESIRREMIMANLQQKAIGRDVVITNEQIEHFIKTEGDLPINPAIMTYHVQNILVPINDDPSSTQIQKAHDEATKILLEVKKGSDFSKIADQSSHREMMVENGDLGERHLAELPEIFAKEVANMKPGEISRPLRAANGFHILKLVAISGQQQQPRVTLTHARHILLKPDASMLPDEAKKQVNNIYQQLKSGKDFAKMAKHYSLDTGSAVKGGDLGWVSPGETVPEFEKVMDKLTINEVSKPVKTRFGWHLIQVLERKQQENSLAFKKQQIRQYLYQKKFAEAVQNWQHHIRTDAYVNILEKDLV